MSNSTDHLSINPIRENVQRQLMQNIKQDFVRIFKRYRDLVNKIQVFRNEFFNILKSEILKSCNRSEKMLLVQIIQEEFYSSNYVAANNFDIAPNNFNNSGQITDFPQNGYGFQSDNYGQTDYVENDTDLVYQLLSRSAMPIREDIMHIREDNDQQLTLIHNLIKELTIKEDKNINFTESNDKQLILIDNLFSELTETIEKDEEIFEKFNKLKSDYGDEIFKRIILHVPENKRQSSTNLEPIMFQLACKIDQYELALNKLHEDNLLNLNQRNQYEMTVYNVLLIKDFELFHKFLSYLNKRKLENGIRYFIQKTDGVDNVNMVINSGSGTPEITICPIKTNRKDTMQNIDQYNSVEKFLIHQGILYCRTMLKEQARMKILTIEEKKALIKELDSLNVLSFILNESLNNQEVPYFNYLPLNLCVIDVFYKSLNSNQYF